MRKHYVKAASAFVCLAVAGLLATASIARQDKQQQTTTQGNGNTQASANSQASANTQTSESTQANTDETFKLSTTVAITGLESFDISWVDASLGKYFLADRSNKSVDVIKTGSSPSLSTQIVPPAPFAFAGNVPAASCAGGANVCSGPDGLLTLPNTGGKEIWVGDGPTPQSLATTGVACPTNAVFSSPPVALGGTCSTVKIFPASATDGAKPSHVIVTNGRFRADELCFDPTNQLVLMANDADTPPFVSFISTKTYTVVKQLAIPEATNGIEQCQWSPRTGLFYLNIPEVNGPGDDTKPGNVYVLSPKSMTVVNKFIIPIAQCAGPQGMAIGPDEQILLGCNAPSIPSGVQNSVIINENSGVVIATLNGLGGADEVWFNPGDGHYFLALGSNTNGHELGIVDSHGHRPDTTISVTSKANPHSVAADPVLNDAYLPVSEGVNIYAPVGTDDHPVSINRSSDNSDDQGD